MSTLASILLASPLLLTPAAADTVPTDTLMVDAQAFFDSMQTAFIDSVEATFTYQHGDIVLSNGVATLKLPAGFKFLDGQQSERVLTELWGNPSTGGVLGMILPEESTVFADSSYAFVVQYDEMGYVKDDDADDIDYDALLKQMQEDDQQENEQRAAMGSEPAYTIGWAATPFYDKEHKVLHWAKEIQFGDDAEVNTLNYNVRVLGRKGVLVLNAVATMSDLAMVQQHLPEVLNIVQFADGQKYEQFDSNVDEVAAWTIGGLVAGKLLAKVGLWALLIKNIKLVFIALAALGAAIWKFFGGRKKDSEPPSAPPQA